MNWRKYHRVVALIFTLPLILVGITGLVLQLRNQLEVIQPKAISAELSTDTNFITLEKILQSHDGEQIDQIIYKPGKKNLSIRMKDGMEVQIHPQSGEVLKKAMRMTNVLIDFHQGTWLGSIGQYFIHFPAGLAFVFLIISGIMIYPFRRKQKT
jgi:uncharacterized iron-regulated membrane protein